jgi:guanosine-3',5'-bis(diphosphate) 3'-pyrophosphohydrolase
MRGFFRGDSGLTINILGVSMLRQYELVERIKSYDPDVDEDLVNRAYVYAMKKHGSQQRASGDPYFSHPLEVAGILTDMKLDAASVITALLHDTVEDTDATIEEIERLFGRDIARLVDGVTKLTKIELQNPESKQAENFRKLVLAMSEDIRVLLVKLADRLHNMRTIQHIPKPEKQRRIALETLEIYVPLAERIGIRSFKEELEDIAFGVLNPEARESITTRLNFLRTEGEGIVEKVISRLNKDLEDTGVELEVTGREKTPYSIWRKMQRNNISFEQLSDIMAFRCVVPTVTDCYHVLGVIHGKYPTVPGRFKDYISLPKTNGYRSLHTTVIGPESQRVEIQIRTRQMHEEAELGVAAHWAYKEGSSGPSRTDGKQYRWLRELMDIVENAPKAEEFLEHTKLELYQDRVFCFTPQGDLIELPNSATPVDFAYAVHTDVGNSCVGVKVERRTFSLSKPLENGQTVEIITSPRAKPNANWLNFVVSAKARSRIRHYLKNQRSEEAVTMGNRLLRHALGKNKLDNIPQADIDRVVLETKHNSFDELLADIGLGNELSVIVARRLFGETTELSDKQNKVAIRGTEGLLVAYSRCCHPIPDDEIVAVLSPGRGMAIHQNGCSNIRKLSKEEPHRVLVMNWGADVSGDFHAAIRIELINHQGTLATLTNTVASCGSNIVGLQTEEKESNIYYIDLEVTITNRLQLANVMRKIRTMPEVQRVSRHSQAKQN